MRGYRRLLYLLRLLWVLLAILLLWNVGIRIPGKPVALIDVSYSSRLVFGESVLKGVESELRKTGFRIKRFGSDTMSDIQSALAGASPPILLVSDGMHNGEGDPLSVAYDKEVNVLLLRPRKLPVKVTHVRMKTPATVDKTAEITVELSSPLNDTLTFVYGKDKRRVYATDRATFKVKVKRKDTPARIVLPSDTLSFRVFARQPRGVGILVWTPLPVVRFVRWFLTDATLKLMRDTARPTGRYSFTVFVDPPAGTLSVGRPSLYVPGPRGGFRAIRGAFYLKGDVPPIREIYTLDVKYDEVYERVGRYPLIASRGNALFVLSPDIWKVWLADPSSYERFINYLRKFVVRDVEVYTEKPVYAPGETFELRVYPPFPMAVSVNRGKAVRISSLYTYTKRLKAGDTLFVVDVFRKGVRILSETLRINLRDVPAEKVYVGLDTTLLKNMASVSGGKVFRDLQTAIDVLKKRNERRLTLSSLLPLFLLVVLIAWTEWFLRRARGMV